MHSEEKAEVTDNKKDRDLRRTNPKTILNGGHKKPF
jgi:hypothetical protein